MNSNENSLQAVKEDGIFKKIIGFLKKLFYKKEEVNEEVIYETKEPIINNSGKQKEFVQSIKFEEDKEKTMLLNIQDELEKREINKKNVHELTKDLTQEQKERLEELYKTQIKEYETSLENYKRQILKLRKKTQFKDNLKVESKDNILILQRKLESGEMQISKLNDKQKDELIELYNNQITIKKEKLANIKQKILNIRKRIEQ